MRPHRLLAAAALAMVAAQGVDSQPVSAPALAPAENGLAYADLVDLALAAPVVAQVRVTRASRLSPREAPDVPPGRRRFLVEAEVAALIRSPAELPASVSWLVDLPDDARGRPARIERRSEFLLLAAPVGGRPGELRLVAPDAQLPYDPATAEQVRAILREAMSPDAPPRITGIGRAFHVAGTLPGESETQIFLQTADGRPISLNILRRSGETPRWSVALSEIVDDAAAPPAPNTLLWYRLACGLPPALPRASVADSGAEDAAAIVADYRLVLRGLGPCVRRRAAN
jgi:hypothetical protein